MLKKIGPYIGVTGFMSRSEVLEALSMVPIGSTHRLMVGVLMSSLTLGGLQDKWPARYPKKEDVRDIFVDNPRVLNLIHYHANNRHNLYRELIETTKFVGADCFDGFQINVRWPSVNDIRNFQELFPDKLIVMQIGSGALKDVENIGHLGGLLYLVYDHRACCRWIIDSILIDASGGNKLPLNAVKGGEWLSEVHERFPEMGIGIAGGLGPDTLHLVEPLIPKFPKLSIDAEGQLRTLDDSLDLYKTRLYVQRAFNMFHHNQV